MVWKRYVTDCCRSCDNSCFCFDWSLSWFFRKRKSSTVTLFFLVFYRKICKNWMGNSFKFQHRLFSNSCHFQHRAELSQKTLKGVEPSDIPFILLVSILILIHFIKQITQTRRAPQKQKTGLLSREKAGLNTMGVFMISFRDT